MESLLTWLCVSQKQSYRTDAATTRGKGRLTQMDRYVARCANYADPRAGYPEAGRTPPTSRLPQPLRGPPGEPDRRRDLRGRARDPLLLLPGECEHGPERPQAGGRVCRVLQQVA